eukprot:TRINITY_DN36084_c0_g1_i1.p1 TRINITY_DN36084_c0_g1~~TRINITY_DN36084_c0_g1_i1.p1  ORF type:complete len:347 (+),score=100.70 TRINITY_DN36084_c0_g1_i1:84-1043(+)
MGDLGEVFGRLRKRQSETASPAAKPARKRARASPADPAPPPRPRLALDDDAFFDTRGTGRSGPAAERAPPPPGQAAAAPAAAAPAAAPPPAAPQAAPPERRFLCVSGPPFDPAAVYDAVLRQRLSGLGVKSVCFDAFTKVARLGLRTAADAAAAEHMLNGRNVFGSRIRCARSAGREGEILVKNIQDQVTAELLESCFGRYGRVLRTRMMRPHALWQKAYIQYADAECARRACAAMHGARNVVQESPLFVEMTAGSTAQRSSGSAGRPRRRCVALVSPAAAPAQPPRNAAALPEGGADAASEGSDLGRGDAARYCEDGF